MRTLAHPLILLLISGLVVAGRAQAPADAAEEDLPRRARTVARLLQQGEVRAAREEAERGIRTAPEYPLFRRRLAQVHLCSALELDLRFAAVTEQARHSWLLAKGLRFLEEEPEFTDPRDLAHLDLVRASQQEAQRELLTPANRALITDFQQRARTALAGSETLLGDRSRALSSALEEIKLARRLGDRSTELELTELWARTVVLLWREGLRRLKEPEPRTDGPRRNLRVTPVPYAPELPRLATTLAPFASVTPEGVLRDAAELTKTRPTDPEALAGVADLLTVVVDLTGRPDPVRQHLKALLDRKWGESRAGHDRRATPQAAEQVRTLYLAARELKGDPDAVADPVLASLVLYERAVKEDAEAALPYLRLRLYPVWALLDRERAPALMAELQEKQPRNAAVLLERARAAYLAENNAREGLRNVRLSGTVTGFDRSFLVAVPTPLRTLLSPQPLLRQLVRDGWPGFGWLFDSLRDLEHPTTVRDGQRVALPPAERETRVAALRLRLQLAERLCLAPDYPDRALGIQEKTEALEGILKVLSGAPPAEQAPWLVARERHAQAFAEFPRAREWVYLNAGGLSFREYPRVGAPPEGRGLALTMSERGTLTLPIGPIRTRK